MSGKKVLLLDDDPGTRDLLTPEVPDLLELATFSGREIMRVGG